MQILPLISKIIHIFSRTKVRYFSLLKKVANVLVMHICIFLKRNYRFNATRSLGLNFFHYFRSRDTFTLQNMIQVALLYVLLPRYSLAHAQSNDIFIIAFGLGEPYRPSLKCEMTYTGRVPHPNEKN